MSLIRDAKPMVVPATAMTMVVLILALSITSREAVAAELIPDSELASLYGGWFPNPECVEGASCPPSTYCTDELQCCTFCTAVPGYKCQDSWSWYPDWSCDDGSGECATENLGRGWCFCTGDNCCEVGSCSGSQWDCGGIYETCDD